MNKTYIAIILLLGLSLGYAADAQPVKLDLYYESLCPGCYQYLTTALKTILYNNGLDSIYDLTLYPYGNARQSQGEGGEWKFQCQHGPKECYGNVIEACILGLYTENKNNQNKAIICLEEQERRRGDFDSALKICATQFNLDADKVEQCAKNKQGNAFQHTIADATDNLNPRHKWVPWMVINNQYNEQAQDDLERNPVQFLCNTYQGTKPPACNNQQDIIDIEFFETSKVCARENAASYFLRK